MTDIHFDTIESAIDSIRNGRMVIVVDDESRENEGDLVMAAQFVTDTAINFMVQNGRGLVCVPMVGADLDRLEIPAMVAHNEDSKKTAFTISVDAKPSHGISTGISPADRARTIQLLIQASSTRSDFVTPGHVFPLTADPMGVLRRAGHTEAAVDLAKLAGLTPAGVICEVISADGKMARVPELRAFANVHGLPLITIQHLIRHRIQYERFIVPVENTRLPTAYGSFRIHAYQDQITGHLHLAVVKGDLSTVSAPLVRVHSECLTGDVFGSCRCDCGDQLHAALNMIESEGTGVLLYMRQEGRGIGLDNKLRAYRLQDDGADTVEANLALGFAPDLRDYGVGAQILLDLGIKRMRLMTNNPTKVVGLEGYGLQIEERVSIMAQPNQYNEGYLQTKVDKMGHLLTQENQ